MIFTIPNTDLNQGVQQDNFTFCITQGMPVLLEMNKSRAIVTILSLATDKHIKYIYFINGTTAERYFKKMHLALMYNEQDYPEVFL